VTFPFISFINLLLKSRSLFIIFKLYKINLNIFFSCKSLIFYFANILNSFLNIIIMPFFHSFNNNFLFIIFLLIIKIISFLLIAIKILLIISFFSNFLKV